MNLFLIGYRGTGKSTVAAIAAPSLGFRAIDLDDQIEQAAGRSVAEIFATSGEAAFRELESRCLEECLKQDRLVVSTGGGAVVRAENREMIRRSGPAVWLKAREQTILARLSADPATVSRRPRLSSEALAEEIHSVLAARTPIYRQCARFEVDTDHRTPDEVARMIVEWFAGRPPESKPTAHDGPAA